MSSKKTSKKIAQPRQIEKKSDGKKRFVYFAAFFAVFILLLALYCQDRILPKQDSSNEQVV